ncbi:uncharacterized mitochondrial protein AtMg00810-like [Arachis stenosperma]|uniref:uncharacterized mitochondrial protein AtMg00810-like n=1 Tax=Arachis stenosperma TaxID=217475 RepID=UPI0025ABC37C|nr:uncharacterized mitochondrial protein AtMg00810-like [Arachis stenosperma]
MGELHYFLRIQVTKTDAGGLVLSQEKYLPKKAKMENCKPCHTPPTIFGSLQHLIATSPELAYCVGKLSQFMHTLLYEHWKMVKKVAEGRDSDDRKFIGGFCVFLGSNLVSWSSKK